MQDAEEGYTHSLMAVQQSVTSQYPAVLEAGGVVRHQHTAVVPVLITAVSTSLLVGEKTSILLAR